MDKLNRTFLTPFFKAHIIHRFDCSEKTSLPFILRKLKMQENAKIIHRKKLQDNSKQFLVPGENRM